MMKTLTPTDEKALLFGYMFGVIVGAGLTLLALLLTIVTDHIDVILK